MPDTKEPDPDATRLREVERLNYESVEEANHWQIKEAESDHDEYRDNAWRRD